MEYNFSDIENKWQAYWEKNKTFKTVYDPSKPKYYILDMFPYPSGAGLHVGHPEGYTATDIVARYKRMKGFNVLHPMGWDAFGLPAEQYAIQTGTHPAITTNKNCDTFRRQIKMLGLSYDWEREINTTDVNYFKWTQWIFARLYNTWFDEKLQKGRPISELPIPAEITASGKDAVRNYIDSKRLAYYDNAQVWYCNTCKIVCANEEVLTDGTHEKCGNPVHRKNLKQWMLRIPFYAERLLSGLDDLDWPEGVKDMQRNWIGRSTGAEVDFEVEGLGKNLRVFTTRPDTLFGATYMVIAPEHPMVDLIKTGENAAKVDEYIKAAAIKSELDRTDLSKEKTGVFSGRYAINPVNGKKVPIWIADYVLTGYGTGAIMAVPAHDTRDFEFARKFGIDIICILDPVSADEATRNEVLAGKICWTEDGNYINSSSDVSGLNINGLNKENGIKTVINWLDKTGKGEGKVNYKMRDWLFSRQRYWGEPFPVIHWEDGEVSIIEDNQLPLELPQLDKYQPGDNGESPLANATDWLIVTDKNGRKGRRETNTMPQWAGSCWYYLRYIDPTNNNEPFSKELENYWMPVDLYVGGAEHAVLHLLYSRFWHKVLFDLGIVSTNEPYQKLYNQGMILAFAYETKTGMKVIQDFVAEENGKFYMIDDEYELKTNTDTTNPDTTSFETKSGLKITKEFVVEKDGKFYEKGEELKQIVAKMSKSLKNVVNPDDVVKQYGADSLRLYEMFMGPLDATKPWTDTGVKGVSGFLGRVFRFFCNTGNYFEGAEDTEVLKVLHKTIQKVGFDIENLSFNTAIAQMMIFNNLCIKKQKVSKQTAGDFAKVLAPFAPHLAEEIWKLLGNTKTLAYESFPAFDEKHLTESTCIYPVSFNGKKRFELELPVDMPVKDIETEALANPSSQKWLEGKAPKKVIIVPNKIINIVI